MLLEPERLSIGVSEIGFSELETCSGSNSCFRLPGVLICLWASIPQIIGVVKSAKLQFLRITIELVKKTRLYSGKTFEKMILKNGGRQVRCFWVTHNKLNKPGVPVWMDYSLLPDLEKDKKSLRNLFKSTMIIWNESKIMMRVIYKSKNQHRSSRHFQKLLQVDQLICSSCDANDL